MTVAELIARLSKLDPNMEVMILDSHNGGGCHRELNFGPTVQTITDRDAEETADCEERSGESVVTLGFGCY